MPIRAIILRVTEDKFKAYQALKRPNESWERMFDREMFGGYEKNLIASNGKVIVPVLWAGKDIPDGWVPLDGRTIDGITIPDRRDRFEFGVPDHVDPMEKYTSAILTICEIARIEDIIGSDKQ